MYLDGLPVAKAADLENHYSRTSVSFINVRTGRMETRWAVLPNGALR